MSWLDAFFSSYATVQDDGSALPQRSVLNFTGDVTATDDVANARTNISVNLSYGVATAATPDTLALRGASAEIYFGTVIIVAGASLAVASAAALSAAGLIYDVANVAPEIGHTVVAGAGATAGVPLTITAQAGRQQSGGNANNAGGALVLAGGPPGTGGGGAAGIPGLVTIKSGAANVGSFGNGSSGTVATYTLDASRTSMVWSAPAASQSQIIQANGAGGSIELQAMDAAGSVKIKSTTTIIADATGATAATWTPLSAGATTLSIAAGATSWTIDQAQAASGAGKTATVKAQRGFAGSAGGILKIGGGAGGTSASDLPGATQIDLGTAVSNASALCSFLVGGASILDISQSAASTALIKAAAKLTIELPISNLMQFKCTTMKMIDTASNFMWDAGTSGGTNAHAFTTSLDIVWINGKTQAPIIWQNDNVTNSATGQTLTIQAQNATGTTATGGALDIRTGTGTTAAGVLTLRVGATVRIQAGSTGIALFGGTERAQPTRAGQLTDNSGGTSGGNTIAVIGGAVDPTAALKADTANAIATLAARLNLLEGKISAAGTGIGVTA